MVKKSVIPWLVLLVCLCALGYEGFSRNEGGQYFAFVGVLSGWLVVIAKLRALNTYGLISGLCFGAIGVLCLLQTETSRLWPAIFQSQANMLKYILLYGSVIWLRVQAMNSWSLNVLARWSLHGAAGFRALTLSMLSHWLGAGFNLAGLGLLSPLVSEKLGQRAQKSNVVFMVQGFSAATVWSPVFASIIVILATFPTLSWIDIVPWAFLAATGIFCANSLASLFVQAKNLVPREKRGADPFPIRAVFIVMGLLVLLFVTVFLTNMKITLALGMVAPVFAFIWLLTKDSIQGNIRDHFAKGLTALGNLHSEIFVFSMANLLAVGVGAWVSSGHFWSLSEETAFLNWLSFAFVYLVVAGLGVHPLAIVLVGVQLIPPTALGISELAYAVMILSLWASSTIGSPMSANNLMFSRMLSVPVWKLAWVWNARAVALNWVMALLIGFVCILLA